VPTVAAGVHAAIREGADAIVVGTITSPDEARSVVDAVASGHLVLATVTAPARAAVEHLVDLLAPEHRELARKSLEQGLLATIATALKGGVRSFEVLVGRGG